MHDPDGGESNPPAQSPFIPLANFAGSSTSRRQNYRKMSDQDDASHPSKKKKMMMSFKLIASYVSDWLVIVIAGVIGLVLGKLTPNKRPFWLENPDISFPFTVDETVPVSIAVAANTLAPAVIVAIVALVFVPGSTVPKGTPRALIWRRKLWELHAGLLGLALSVIAAWLITNGMKNMFGKPRPDLLSRCQPDLANITKYIVGGIAGETANGQLVSADICKNPDKHKLDDGFRSFPSGHSSSSAAGLIYLSLFLASKFAVTFPFLAPSSYADSSSFSSFPSRLPRSYGSPSTYEAVRSGAQNDYLAASNRISAHNQTVSAVRRQAAAAPLYLLLIIIIPFFAAVFISSSRWFDYRHHGFDIMFGFVIGTVTAFFAFRYYHLPISQGAGWAWAPRSHDKAFWAGVGSYSYATEKGDHLRTGDEEEAIAAGGDDGSSYEMQKQAPPRSRSHAGESSSISV